jgi:signal transduction histidine kinase
MRALLHRFQGRSPELWLDLGLVGLAIAAQVEVWVLTEAESEWLLAPLALLATLAPVARRRAPFGAPLVALLALTAMAFTAERYVPATATTLVVVMVVAWIIGAYNALPVATAGLGATLALVLVVVGRDPTSTIGQALAVFVVITVSWAIGIGWYRRTRHAAALEQRALRAEREREAAARIAVAEERARIARELHDVVAHSVAVMVLHAGAVRTRLAPRQEQEREGLLTIESTGREALAEMRRLLGAMRADSEGVELGPQPGLDRLDQLVDHIRASGLAVQVRVEGDPVPLAAGIDLSAYRIVQEGLTNTLKHAGPARAEIVVRYGSSDVEVEVVDDGHAAREADLAGHGLVGMRERAKLYGGDFEAGPRAGGGFAVRARLPLSPGPA